MKPIDNFKIFHGTPGSLTKAVCRKCNHEMFADGRDLADSIQNLAIFMEEHLLDSKPQVSGRENKYEN